LKLIIILVSKLTINLVLVSFVDQPAGTLKASQALKNLGAVQVDFINQLQHLLIQLQLLHTQLCSPRRIVQPSGVGGLKSRVDS
jgi:hypothetical protein